MEITKILTIGDSLADSGNALGLAYWYDGLPFTSLPDGTPTPEAGYFEGRFSNGYVFADLISNKYVGEVTQPTFPFRYEDPWLGLPIAPFASDPEGASLNFAYGGAQVIKGSEAVLDMSQQVDALQDAIDGNVPAGSLVIIVLGGNDVRELAPADAAPTDPLVAYAKLDAIAQEIIDQIEQIVDDGGTEFFLSGIADVGIIPRYDTDQNGVLDATEQARADAATDYSQYLDTLIRTVVIPAVEAMGVNITYTPLTDSPGNQGVLSAILPTLSALHGIPLSELENNLLQHQSSVFMDQIHPNAQVHALAASLMMSQLEGTPWIETLPLDDAALGFVGGAAIDWAGDVDTVTIALVAGSEYRIDMLGISTLGGTGPVADPYLELLGTDGTVVAFDDDSGAGFDSVLVYTAPTSGTYTIQVSAVGEVTGDFTIEASLLGGAAMGDNEYLISHSNTLVLENVGGGFDTITTSVSFHLHARSEIEVIQTDNVRGRSDISLEGNEFGQTLIGNRGDNFLDGRGGADSYTGGGGRDTFVLDGDGADTITDLTSSDWVDVTQLLSVSAGTDVVVDGYLRIEGGAIQLDADGGGDSWTTIGHTDATGGVFVYLEDGLLVEATVGTLSKGGGKGGGNKGGGKKAAQAASAFSLATAGLLWKAADGIEMSGEQQLAAALDPAPGILSPMESERSALEPASPEGASVSAPDAPASSPMGEAEINPRTLDPAASDQGAQAPAEQGQPASEPAAPAEAMVADAVPMPPAEWVAAMVPEAAPQEAMVEAKEALAEAPAEVALPGDALEALAQLADAASMADAMPLAEASLAFDPAFVALA